jgi:hypothetical protein
VLASLVKRKLVAPGDKSGDKTGGKDGADG